MSLAAPLHLSYDFDPAAADEINERWNALGIPPTTYFDGFFRKDSNGRVIIRGHLAPEVGAGHSALRPQAYRLRVRNGPFHREITIESGDADGAFYAAMTLAQLPQRLSGKWVLPCVDISDAPAHRK